MGRGWGALARSDAMYFVPGFAQIAHGEGQSPSVHAQRQNLLELLSAARVLIGLG